jgi:tetratricopeptide (TPR) repeat protein
MDVGRQEIDQSELDYRELFIRYLENSIQRLLRHVSQANSTLSAEDRVQTLHTLNFGLGQSVLWPKIRELLVSVAPHMEQAGHRDEWMPYLEQGIQLAQNMDDLTIVAELRLQLGILHQRGNNYDEGRQHLESSATDFALLSDQFNQARVLNRLAYTARLQRCFDESIDLVNQVLQFFAINNSERAYSYHVLALVALDKRNWTEAILFSEKCFELYERERNHRMMARSLINRGFALHRMEEHSAAISVYGQAILLFDKIQDPNFRARAEMNMGNVYNSLNQPDEALKVFQSAEHLFRQTHDLFHLAMANHNQGMAYHKLGQWDRAEMSYLAAKMLKQKIGNTASLVNTLSELGETYLARDQKVKAATVLDEALNELTKIEDQPDYNYLLQTINAQLQRLHAGAR